MKNNNFQNPNSIKLITTQIKLLPNTYYKIRDLHFQYENIDYQIIGGLVIMELSNNHLYVFEEDNKIERVEKYNSIRNKIKSKLIITHILKGSKITEDNIFKPPQILSKVNDIEVSNLIEFREALKKMLIQNNIYYFSFLTEENKYLVLGLDETKKEEEFLSKKYNYILTDYTKKILGLH